MSRHHRGQRRQSLSSSSISVEVDGAVISSPTAAYTADAALAALCVGYMYLLAAYLELYLGGIQYPSCPLNNTTEAAAEAEAAASLASSDLVKKFRCNSGERGEVEGEGTPFYFLPLSSAEMMRSLLLKY